MGKKSYIPRAGEIAAWAHEKFDGGKGAPTILGTNVPPDHTNYNTATPTGMVEMRGADGRSHFISAGRQR